MSKVSLAHDPVRTVTIHGDSRYDEPVVIPSLDEVRLLLATTDRLANSKNPQIAAPGNATGR